MRHLGPANQTQLRGDEHFIAGKQRACCRRKTCYAIAKGILVRPSKCERCGDDSKKPVAHHENYFDHLNVQWLCQARHKRHRDTTGSNDIS